MSDELIIAESFPTKGYAAIPTVYAYYTDEQKAAHGKQCEWWTPFGYRPEDVPFEVGGEREFIAKIAAENPGRFSNYLISWSTCD